MDTPCSCLMWLPDASERVMLLGRGQQAMEKAFNQVRARLPFAIKEVHPDTGTEFFK